MTTGEWIAIRAERNKKNHREGKWVRCWKDEARDCLYEMLDSRRRTAARLRTIRNQRRAWMRESGWSDYSEAAKADTRERRQAVQEAREGL
jgi:hypothetical protein